MENNKYQKSFENSSSIDYSSNGSHSDKMSFFNSKTHFPQKSCQGIIGQNTEPLSKQNLTTKNMSESILNRSSEQSFVHESSFSERESNKSIFAEQHNIPFDNFLPEFVPLIQQIAKIQKMYCDKVMEVDRCQKKIEELEQEKEDFKPMKLIHNYEAKLKEKQNVIDVLERRILILQKKSPNGEKSSDSMASSDSFVSVSTTQPQEIFCGDQNQEILKETPILNEKVVSDVNKDLPLVALFPKGKQDQTQEFLSFNKPESKANQQAKALEMEDPVKIDSESKQEFIIPDNTVSESPIDSVKKSRKPRTTKPKENQNLEEKVFGKKKPTPTENPEVTVTKPTSGRKRKEILTENPKVASSIVAQMKEKASQKEQESNDETDPDAAATQSNESCSIQKEVVSSEMTLNTSQDNQPQQQEQQQEQQTNELEEKSKDGSMKPEHLNTEKIKSENETKNDVEQEKVMTESKEKSTENVAKKMKGLDDTKVYIKESKVETPVIDPKKLVSKEKKQTTPSTNYQLGQKINVEEYQIVCLKTKTGKILEYYMNKKDEIVYKKVSDGMIGVKVGYISEFGKFDSNGHFVLNN
jgi:hypothetical protein